MRMIAAVLIVTLLLPGVVLGQGASSDDTWRDFARRIDVGSELKVRLVDGTRFRATLIRADDSALLLQPKTRVPVPVQSVLYPAVASLEIPKQGGMGAGKAIAIGAASGAAAFWAMLAIAFAVWSD